MAASEPWGLKYFGVGNENWGCGGRMTAEYYSDLYRRYGVYMRATMARTSSIALPVARATTTITGLR